MGDHRFPHSRPLTRRLNSRRTLVSLAGDGGAAVRHAAHQGAAGLLGLVRRALDRGRRRLRRARHVRDALARRRAREARCVVLDFLVLTRRPQHSSLPSYRQGALPRQTASNAWPPGTKRWIDGNAESHQCSSFDPSDDGARRTRKTWSLTRLTRPFLDARPPGSTRSCAAQCARR